METSKAHSFVVADIMSTELITLAVDENLDLAREVMSLARIRHLPVTSGGELVGLVTHRDILRNQASILAELGPGEQEEILASVPIYTIMTRDIQAVPRDMPLRQAGKLLLDQKYGCLPVVQHEELIGIVTEADFVQWALMLSAQWEDI